jgi:hypothetical protein
VEIVGGESISHIPAQAFIREDRRRADSGAREEASFITPSSKSAIRTSGAMLVYTCLNF